MKAAEDEQNTFQMEPNPLARRQADNGNGNGTANPDYFNTAGLTVVTSTTVNASFNAQPSDADSANAASSVQQHLSTIANDRNSRQANAVVLGELGPGVQGGGTSSSSVAASRSAAVAGAGAAAEAQYAGYEPPGVTPLPTASGAVYVGGSAAPPTHGDAAASTIVYATYDAGTGADAGADEAQYAVYEPPGDATAPEIIYATPLEDDGRRVVSRVPNVMYEPAANNVYDAGVRSNANRTATIATAGNGGSGGYYDADPAPNDDNAEYATPLDDDVAGEARNQPVLVQVYGDDNGHDSDADDNGGTAA